MTDCNNHRVQVFDRNGKFLRKFGECGSLDHQLKNPEGLSINGNGDITVADKGNKLIKIFSSGGEYLRKLVEQVLWSNPITVYNTVNILLSQTSVIIALKCLILKESLFLNLQKEGTRMESSLAPLICQLTKKDC